MHVLWLVDPSNSGHVRRTEFIEILSRLGLYLLEQGKVLEQSKAGEHDLRQRQLQLIEKVKLMDPVRCC